jgi:hypothetical protein
MLGQINKYCRVLVASGCVLVLTAAPDSIGVVRSAGDFRVDGSTVRGNSTVFDGSVIETSDARSVIQLNGAQITLSPDSRAKVYGDHTVLIKGEGMMRESAKHVIEVDSLRISATSSDAAVQVDVQSPNHFSVVARTGSVAVRNASGLLLADVRPGLALAFDEQTGSGSTAVKMEGIVTVRDGKYYITDATTHVTAELKGMDLSKLVGKTVDITGTLVSSSGVVEIVQVTGATPIGNQGGHGAFKAGAIIGGVAIGGTVIGLAAAGSFKGPASTSGQ